MQSLHSWLVKQLVPSVPSLPWLEKRTALLCTAKAWRDLWTIIRGVPFGQIFCMLVLRVKHFGLSPLFSGMDPYLYHVLKLLLSNSSSLSWYLAFFFFPFKLCSLFFFCRVQSLVLRKRAAFSLTFPTFRQPDMPVRILLTSSISFPRSMQSRRKEKSSTPVISRVISD